MVLEEEFYPHGGYQKPGYGLDYFSKNGYGGGHKEDYYSSENSSSVQMVRPNILTPEPPKHFVLGNESQHHSGYPHKETSSGGYGGGGGHHHGFPDGAHHGGGGGGGHMHHGGYGSFGHGYPKPTFPFLGGGGGMHHNHHHHGGGVASATSNYEYESEHESYTQKLPGKYESMNYDYYGEGRNRCPTVAPAMSPYYGQAHHHNNKNHHWTSAKGVSDGAEWVSKGL